jgi:Na+/H+ antiporter NhaA
VQLSTADRIKLIVEITEIAEKVSRYLPIVVFSYAGLTLVFAVINFVEYNITLGIVLCFFAGFGIYLAIRIYLTRKRRKRIPYT